MAHGADDEGGTVMRKNGMFTTQKLTYASLLVALQVILGNLTQIPSIGKQFNFGFLPIAVAGALLGAPWAIIVGALGDFFGAHLFPQGAYFAGFTLTNALVGLCYALPLYQKKPAWVRVIVATLAVECCNLFINSYWLSLLYASRAYWGWVGARAVSYLFETPIYAVLTYLTLKALQKAKLPEGVGLPQADKQPKAMQDSSIEKED